MEIVFLGTGPNKKVENDGRTRSSLAVNTKNTPFLIDCSPDFSEQVERENINDISFILFTHGHNDCTGGIPQLHTWMKKKDMDSMPVFLEPATWKRIKEDYKNVSFLSPRFVQPDVATNVNEIHIIPFRVEHSIQPGYPAVGYRIDDGLVYSEDVGDIPKENMKYYSNADVVIFDAAMWFGKEIKGHQNTADALKFAKDIKAKKFILMQAGHTYPAQSDAEAQINQYWKEIGGADSEIILAHDGLRLNIKENVSQILSEAREGIYMVRPHGSMIYSGDKSLIIKAKNYKNKIGKLLYLIEDSLCYGIIRLKMPDKIGVTEFNEFQKKHQVTDAERTKWWPNKEVLYSYPFDVIERFPKPKRVSVPQGVQTFVKDFEFLVEIEQEMIHNIKEYDPAKLNIDVLKDDWRIAHAWYSSIKNGRKMIHSLEDVLHIARLIYMELKKRGIEFHPDRMKPYSLELFRIVSGGTELSDLSDPKLLDELQDKIIIKDFMSVCGSYAIGKQKPNDIDVLIRMTEPTDYIKRAVEVRFLKDIGWSDKVHFIWGDPEGPHDTYIPIYDLQLTRIKPLKIVKMEEEVLILAGAAPFFPMKPSKRFYQIDEALGYLFPNGKYAIEKKYNGFRAVLMKSGSVVKIYSDQKRDISKHFQTILNEAKELSNKDFVLDSEIVYKDGGRSEILKYVIGKSELDDSNIALHSFDLITFDGKDITDLAWYERKSMLHKLNFTKHIKEVESMMVDTPEQAKKAITFARNLNGSEGAMIKRYEGKYTKNSHSDAWIKFRNEDSLIVRVMNVSNKEGGNSYLMGIEAPPKANAKYVDNGYLILGNTFVSKEPANEGDHLEVSIEEVWRHTYPKNDDTIRYSIHKPRVIGKSSKPLTNWQHLDDLAVSKGEEVIENEEECEECSLTVDELEGIIVQEMTVEKRGGYWCVLHGHPKKPGSKTDKPFGTPIKCYSIAQYGDDVARRKAFAMHYAIQKSEGLTEGPTITALIPDIQGKVWKPRLIKGPKKLIEEELDNEVKGDISNFPDRMQRAFKAVKESGKWLPYVMQWHLRGTESLHTDLRMDTGENLEGFTLFTPPSTAKPDLLDSDPHNIRGTIKVPQPKEWLTVQGGMQRGAPGTTTGHNAYFAIVSKGKYRPIEVSDHKIVLEFNSDIGATKQVKPINPDDASAIDGLNSKLPDKLKAINGCFSYHVAHIGDRHIMLFDKLKECPKNEG